MPYAKKLRTVALVAAALVLIGTTSASAAGKIGGNGIKKNAIASKHIKNGAVSTKDVKNNNLTGKDLKDGSVGTNDIKNGSVASGDIKDSTIASGDIKNGTVGTGDLSQRRGHRQAKLAPGAVAFPNSLWSTLFRNQAGAAESNVQVGPGGADQMGEGSLRLFAIERPPTWPPSATRSSSPASELDQITTSVRDLQPGGPPSGAAVAPDRDQPAPRGRRRRSVVPPSSPPSSTSPVPALRGWVAHATTP